MRGGRGEDREGYRRERYFGIFFHDIDGNICRGDGPRRGRGWPRIPLEPFRRRG